MPQQIIDIGISPNDGLGDSIRLSFEKTNDNFTELYAQTFKAVANTYFVAVNGSDTNTGVTPGAAFATIEKALQVATDLKLENPAAVTLIDVGPGRYFTDGNLDMPDDSVLRTSHRTTVIAPNPNQQVNNVIRMGSGCFVEGFLFENWQLDSLENPTKGFAVSFRPGAVIRRVPYAHKIAVRTLPTWGNVPPPNNPFPEPELGRRANYLYPIGAGVALADGLVCSQQSTFPNIMTWGATPVSPNGIGYCAKNGGLINAINAVSLWAHKHYLTLSGGQIILSSCSTQFGDFTLVSNGSRQIIFPDGVQGVELFVDQVAANRVLDRKQGIVNQMMLALAGQTQSWTTAQRDALRASGETYVQSIYWCLDSGTEISMENFAKNFYNVLGDTLIPAGQQSVYLDSFENMRVQINALPGIGSAVEAVVNALTTALNGTITSPTRRTQPSLITAIGHQWSSVLAGVALARIPPASNAATIEASILEQDDGVVIASGQDDQGSALFVGGMKISSETGELSGPPFDSAVGRIATKTAIAFSSF